MSIENIKIMLGDAAGNYTDAQLTLFLNQSVEEVKSYCNRELDTELEMCAERIAVLRLNRINTEGLTGQSYSGISENYIDGFPADIRAVLNRKRKIKVV